MPTACVTLGVCKVVVRSVCQVLRADQHKSKNEVLGAMLFFLFLGSSSFCVHVFSFLFLIGIVTLLCVFFVFVLVCVRVCVCVFKKKQ